MNEELKDALDVLRYSCEECGKTGPGFGHGHVTHKGHEVDFVTGHTPLLEAQDPVVDERGMLHNLATLPFGSILRITSMAGSIRGNHFHHGQAHWCWLESGRMLYYERPHGSTAEPLVNVIGPGQVFYSGPGVEHAMSFVEDSVMYCISTLQRTRETHESDTVRISMVQ